MPDPDRLTAAQRTRLRKRADSLAGGAKGEDGGGELNIVPFLDILLNVLMFVLATSLATFTATIDVKAPEAPHGPRADAHPIGLNVVVMQGGFLVSAHGKRVGPGCTDEGAGLAVGSTGGDYDYAGLTACARRLKSEADLPEEQVIVAANPDIPYQAIIRTMDALRGGSPGAGDALFPDVRFAVPR
jgi:biopolymer transport protein TolR